MTPPQDTVYPENLEKACTKCGESKQLDGFYRHKRGLYGRQSWCKICFDAHNEELKQKNIRNREDVPQAEFKICSRIDCDHSGIMQPTSNFTKNTKSKDGLSPECKTCTRKQSAQWRTANLEKKRATDKAWREANKDREKEGAERRRKDNPEKSKANQKKNQQRFNESHPNWWKEWYEKNKERIKKDRKLKRPNYDHEYYIKTKIRSWPVRSVGTCRARAKKKGVPFNMEQSDLLDPLTGKLPEFCRYFPHIKLDYTAGQDKRIWASVDRIVPELGYTKGNICVIWMPANWWKSNGSNPAERARIVEIMRGKKKPKNSEQKTGFLFAEMVEE